MSTEPTAPWHAFLACPRCKSALRLAADACTCTDAACAASYPLVDGVPILIDEQRSVFSIADFQSRKVTTFAESDPSAPPKRHSLLRRLIPSNSRPVDNGSNARFLSGFQGPGPWILVIGAGDQTYARRAGLNLLYSDVYLGPSVNLIADGHDLPFLDGSFDGVMAISVMEHVADPQRCAAEIARVLKPGGRILAATPFMQQVHLGRYDFTRFTHLGHRRLWNGFREIESGVSCGPGMALAWAWQYFLLSFSEKPRTRTYLRAIAKLTSFPLPYFDEFLKNKAGTYDAASSFYFLGEKIETPVGDREILASYRGLDNLV